MSWPLAVMSVNGDTDSKSSNDYGMWKGRIKKTNVNGENTSASTLDIYYHVTLKSVPSTIVSVPTNM